MLIKCSGAVGIRKEKFLVWYGMVWYSSV